MKVHNTLGNGFQEIIYQRCNERKPGPKQHPMEDGESFLMTRSLQETKLL